MIQLLQARLVQPASGVLLRSIAAAALLLALALPAAAGYYATYPGVFTIDMQGPATRVSFGTVGKGFTSRSGGLGYEAGFADVGGSDGDDMQVVEDFRKKFARQTGGSVTEVNTLSDVGDAAEEFTLTLTSGITFRTRVIKIGSRVFLLAVVDPRGRDLPLVWDLFFESFRAL